ncbi:MAG: DUF3737 family protein [Clostridia bacterium]|nr:DUF3737 family protein [Clostridia bacterium]
MKVMKKSVFTGERALFATSGAHIYDCVFEDGESPLKESSDLYIMNSRFSWKYPLWYCREVFVGSSVLDVTARSGIWYTHGITMEDCEIAAPKTFRRSSGITLRDVNMPNALESMWSCSDIKLRNVKINGDYFGMNSSQIEAEGLDVTGNYIFDGGRDIVVRDSRLISKDSFWNCENVTVYDSYIEGEYIGWNSKNVKFVNCEISSNQGFCYMDNLVMENCRLVDTDLAFEYSSVDADIRSHIVSVKNPTSGRITAESIGEIIMECDRVDISRTEITVNKGEAKIK